MLDTPADDHQTPKTTKPPGSKPPRPPNPRAPADSLGPAPRDLRPLRGLGVRPIPGARLGDSTPIRSRFEGRGREARGGGRGAQAAQMFIFPQALTPVSSFAPPCLVLEVPFAVQRRHPDAVGQHWLERGAGGDRTWKVAVIGMYDASRYMNGMVLFLGYVSTLGGFKRNRELRYVLDWCHFAKRAMRLGDQK